MAQVGSTHALAPQAALPIDALHSWAVAHVSQSSQPSSCSLQIWSCVGLAGLQRFWPARQTTSSHVPVSKLHSDALAHSSPCDTNMVRPGLQISGCAPVQRV